MCPLAFFITKKKSKFINVLAIFHEETTKQDKVDMFFFLKTVLHSIDQSILCAKCCCLENFVKIYFQYKPYCITLLAHIPTKMCILQNYMICHMILYIYVIVDGN